MCLYTKDPKVKIAKRRIVCYKILSNAHGPKNYAGMSDIEFMTPYQHTLIDDDIISGKKDFEAKGSVDITKNFDEAFCHLRGGCIHTYQNRKDAKYMCDSEQSVFKCIIPKGTEYYEGESLCGDKNYASKKIRFIKQIA